MAKLDQKFSKGSKFKQKFELEDYPHDFNQPSKKKKRRISRQHEDFLGYNDDSYWD